MSVEAKASCTTTCASETDDGDYETSSEGAMCGTRSKTVTDISPRSSDKTGSEPDDKATSLKLKEEKSSEEVCYIEETNFAPNRLANTQSMLMPQNVCSSDKEETVQTDIAPTSASSSALQKKLKMIVDFIDRLPPSESNPTVSPSSSRHEMVDEDLTPKKLESQTVLSVIEDDDYASPSCSKGVTFHDPPQDEELSKERTRYTSFSRAFTNPNNLGQSQEMDDLIDIAENPHPSIKSFYFPPIFEKDNLSSISRQSSRVMKDMDAISKIDGELRPLQHQLSEIKGKLRALNLTPSLLNQHPYSSQYTPTCNLSGYYVRPVETLGHDSSTTNSLMSPPRDCSGSDRFGNHPFQAANDNSMAILPSFSGKNKGPEIRQQNSCSLVNHGRSLSRCAGGNSSTLTSSWPVTDDESYLTIRDFQFGGRMETDLSGKLMPSVSKSCYRCYKYGVCEFHKPHTSTYYDDMEIEAGYSGYGKYSETMSPSSKSADARYQNPVKAENVVKGAQITEPEEREAFPLTRKSTGTVVTPHNSASSKVRLVSVNSSEEKRHTGRTNPEESPSSNKTEIQNQELMNSESSFKTPRSHSVSASVMVIGADEDGKTKPVNHARVNSQASLTVSKKSQNVMTSEIDYSQRKKSLRDLDVQCSGFTLEQKEVVARKSVEKSTKASDTEDISKPDKDSASVQLAKANEKVVIVPILFTDGIPEPPKGPLFNFTRSRHHVHRSSNHRILKLEKRSSSLTQNSIYSGNSADSTAMESFHTSHRLIHRNSEKSLSCVSRTASSIHSKNPSHLTSTTKAYSDSRHSKGRHSHSSKAHSEPTKRGMKKVIHGMRSSPEDFLCDT